ncbi:MAG TPA: hypothetical protein VGD55_00110 [Acidothermaceae bacterium]
MKNVSKSTMDVTFARGLAMSELGSTGATWRPAVFMFTPKFTPMFTPMFTPNLVPSSTLVQAAVQHPYAAATAAFPTVKTTVTAAIKQHLVKTDAGRDNRTTEGPSSRRIPV